MNHDAHYPVRDVVLVGGGHTHALVLRKWGMAPPPDLRLTLINPGPFAPYSGMLPGFVAGHYSHDEVVMDLVPLAEFAGARIVFGAVNGLDPEAKRIAVEGRPTLSYDVVSLNVGITAEMPNIPGFAQYGVPVKPFASFVPAWQGALDSMRNGEMLAELTVIGGGVAGVELALAMNHCLKSNGLNPRITVLERQAGILFAASERTRAIMTNAAEAAGIDLVTNAEVTRITANGVELRDGRTVASGFTVTAAGAKPHGWLRDTGLDLTDGFVTVDRDLRAQGQGAIFAVGDCAHMAADPRPKAGVFAVRQAPVLLHNLWAQARNWKLREFRPQSTFLKLISIGGKDALAEKGRVTIRHPLMWRLKDRIDRGFMAKFADLPAMKSGDVPDLCGGCGAKVGGAALRDVIDGLPEIKNAAVKSVRSDDAALLDRGDKFQVMTTDHLRAFTDDPYVMGGIAANHAMGDIWAMGARPEGALANLVLPRAHPRVHKRMLEEVMAGISEVVTAAGADILGGHTSEGAEMCVGLTVTGYAKNPLTLSGARPGDKLILTKPVGTGTILAGAMARTARGDWLEVALDSMSRSLAIPSEILRESARAMTDVTGFGLAGHLSGMMEASGVSARLWWREVPTLEGAEVLAARGVRSSLYQSNLTYAPISGLDPAVPRAALMHDPQTAGGLLAAVPEEACKNVVSRLRDAGETVAVIGDVSELSDDRIVAIDAAGGK